MELGVVGKPNVGKSTFFAAATLAEAERANYPFTTVKPNRGVGYVRTPCPHTEFGKACNPRNSLCKNGTRFVPVEMIDVAGLVPGAHEGKGLGNQFLDDLRQAHALIHIIDASGSTDIEGQPVATGSHDPVEDVRFLEREITMWIKHILDKNWRRFSRRIETEHRRIEDALMEQLTGLSITQQGLYKAIHAVDFSAGLEAPSKWTDEEITELADTIRKHTKPMILALNKCDIAPEENIKKLKELDGYIAIETSAEYELALRKAADHGLISYEPGGNSFEITQPDKLNTAQTHALEKIASYLEAHRDIGTGIQVVIEKAVFELLDLIVVYPVEDENKLTDKDGNVLPDAFLLPRGSTARDLAYKVHTDLGDNFIRAVDARSKRIVGHDHELQHGDIIKIIAKA